MSNATDLIAARAKRQRQALSRLPEWTAEQALEAALCDIRTGKLKPEALVVVYAAENAGNTDVGTYLASDGVNDDAFWLTGMLQRVQRILFEDEP